jgi:ribulose-bisphosphate carboxylase large chain
MLGQTSRYGNLNLKEEDLIAGGALGHKDGIVAGRQVTASSVRCVAGGGDLIDYAKEHEELRGAFETFQEDADNLHPGWREQLGVHK